MTTYTWLDNYNVKTLLDPIKPLTILEWVTCGFLYWRFESCQGSSDTDVGLKGDVWPSR